MDTKYVDQMTKMTKNLLDSMAELQEINSRTVQTLAKQQLQAAEEYMNAGSDNIKSLADVKDLKEAMNKQVNLATEMGEMMKNQAKETMDVLNGAKSDLDTLVEKNVELLKSVGKV